MNSKKTTNTIYWGVLVLMLLGTVGLGAQLFFVISIAYYSILILKNRGKIWIPKVPGIRLYMLFIIYGTVIGLILYPFRNVLRDLYYILPTLVWIFISYHLGMKECNAKEKMLKTLYLYGGVVSVKCIIQFLIHPVLDFGVLRSIFGTGVYEIGFILPIMVMEVLVFKKTIFSKVWDGVIVFAMTVQIAFSFGRIALLQPIITLCVLMFFAARYKREHRKIATRIAVLLGMIVILGMCVFYIVPNSVTNVFLNKFLDIYTEVDTSQTISSVGDAMNSWRAYEMQAAQTQWSNSSLIVQFFGAGIGKGVHINYIPHTWEGVVVGNEIPLLHNAFYTLLPKGGIVAVFVLFWMLMGTAIKGFRFSKYSLKDANIGSIIAAVSIAAIANAYVVRGPVRQGAFLTWAVLIGYLSAILHSKGDLQDEL